MSVEGMRDVVRLAELLKEEQTWIGRYHGHKGQAEVALREAEYWNDVLAKMGDDVEDFVRRKWERNLEKARARREYHLKQMETAERKLREIKAEIRKIIGGEEK